MNRSYSTTGFNPKAFALPEPSGSWDSNATSVCESPPSPVQCRLNEVACSLGNIHDAISSLENRLQSLLMPDNAKNECSPNPPLPVMSMFESQLETQRATAMAACYRLDQLLSRLAV
jgi:hypothetical protein